MYTDSSAVSVGETTVRGPVECRVLESRVQQRHCNIIIIIIIITRTLYYTSVHA